MNGSRSQTESTSITQCPTPGMVSVVIPAYNAESSIESCVRSVLVDAHSAVEVIIVDDGSTDDTPAVCERLTEACNGTVKYLRQTNSGANRARNYGLREARGEFIQFLDADDELQNDKLAESVSKFDTVPSLVCVYARADVELHNGEMELMSANSQHVKMLADKRSNLFTCALQTALPVWKTSFLIDHQLWWDESLNCWQEAEFHVRCLLATQSSEQVSEIPVHGLLFRRSELSDQGISSRYWSHEYIVGQYRAITKMVESCRLAGCPSTNAQHLGYLHRLVTRSVVGNQPIAFREMAKELGIHGNGMKDHIRAKTPFIVYRMGYVSYRFIKRLINR